jgi:hypothetical protein
MRQVITVIVLLLFAACSTMEFETPPDNSVVTAYINQNYWAADSLSEAYYFENYLFISAKGGNENIILKIENPVVGDNSNVEIEYINTTTNQSIKSKSNNISLFLNVLDTINAQPSLVNGTFNGQINLENGKNINIQEGKINNAVTQNLFCENSIRSLISSNTKIGGQWELVRIIDRKTSMIQNPTCHNKVLLSFFDENNMPGKIDNCDCTFMVEGPQNTLRGDFTILDTNSIGFFNQSKSNNETTKYNAEFEKLVFESIVSSTSYYINNSLMHLESKNYVAVFYRKS